MRTPTTRSVRSTATILIAGGILAGTFLSPAGAHIDRPGHLYNAHLKSRIARDFFTKQAANSKFVKARSGSHVFTSAASNATAHITSVQAGSALDLGGFQVTVPAGQEYFVIAEYTAESACYGAGAGYCIVDVRVDGGSITDHPNSGGDFAFDSTGAGTENDSSWESHTIRRVSDPLPPGVHTVTFHAWTTNDTTFFRLDDSLSTVAVHKA